MPSQFSNGGFGNPMQVQGSMGGLGNINPTLGQQKQKISKLGVQGKSPMPGVNSAYAKNPQAGTPSGARSFMNSGAGANGMLNTMKSRLGQNKLGGFGR
jgi:hypothetical protein